MNLPNLITILRILLTPLLVIFLMQGNFTQALLVFVAAGISDGVDGFLARLLRQKTVLGAYIDPIADKLLINASHVTLAILGIMPSWMAVLVVSRDIIIIAGIGILALNERPLEIKPTFDSKTTTLLQLICICFFLAHEHLVAFHHWEPLVLILAAGFTIISGLRYIAMGLQILGQANGNHENLP